MYLPKRVMAKISLQVVLVSSLLWVECTARSEPLAELADFDEQVEQLLSQELMTADELARVTESVEDLKNTLTRRWEGVELQPFGSTKTGLAFKSSDLDVHVKIPNYNHSSQEYLVLETAKIFYQDPTRYSKVRYVVRPNLSRLSYYDNLLGIRVDLSFNNHDGIEVSELVKYLINLDERYIPLIVLIKFWCRTHKITARDSFASFHFYLMTIFYLQQKQMIPTVYQVQVGTPPHIVNEWNASFKKIPFHIENNDSLYELLGGFFKYYSEFDFENNCISLYVGRPVLRTNFENADTVPDELDMYKNCLRTGACKPLDVHSAVCLQDIFKHNYNSGARPNSDGLFKFINYTKFCVKRYDSLPKGQFLKSINSNETTITW